MAQVTVSIDGKTYRMACDEGQEQHLLDLAGRFDRYVVHLKNQFGEIGDLRLTVMAGIMIMDEMNELSRQLSTLQAEAAALRESRDGALASGESRDQAILSAVEEVTERINGLAARLSARPPSAPVN